jgi:hypothetical protein
VWSDMAMIDELLMIPQGKNALVTRGGTYAPASNVWIADGLAGVVAESSPVTRRFLNALAGVARAAGRVHLQQLSDAKAGRIWPSAWLHSGAGAEVVAFCQAHPEAASPYACVEFEWQRAIPYSHRYRAELAAISDAMDEVLAVGGNAVTPLIPYLTKLQDAFRYDAWRGSDIEAMGQADIGWLEIEDDARWLLIAEFTETYADPLKHHIGNDPLVTEWAKEVAEKNGLGPWKTFFEFRLLEMMETVVSSREIEAIRTTIRQLYQDVSETSPSAKARTEFRRALINAGHGANPPKSAKNYPNQDWIRAEYGYRNVIFANQAQEKVRAEMVPALQAAFDTSWSRDPQLTERMLRASALFIVAHEESHPWVVCNEVSWLEELKCNVLGMNALHHASGIRDDVAEVVLNVVAGALNAHRKQPELTARGEMQLQDYYIGDVIFMTHLANGGYFVYDSAGMAVDVRGELAAPLVAAFVERILAIKRGQATAGALYDELYHDAEVFGRFRGVAG